MQGGFATVLLLSGFLAYAAGPRGGEGPEPATILWHADLDTARLTARATGRPLLIVFTSSRCEHSRRLHSTTLARPQIVYYVGRRFVPLQLDVEHDARVAKILGVRSLPTSVMLSPQGDLLGRIVGHVDGHRYFSVLESSRQLCQRVAEAEAAAALSGAHPTIELDWPSAP
jgi:thioredoxin-like negative regulator of GroEL